MVLFRYTHSLNIWLSHSLLGLVSIIINRMYILWLVQEDDDKDLNGAEDNCPQVQAERGVWWHHARRSASESALQMMLIPSKDHDQEPYTRVNSLKHITVSLNISWPGLKKIIAAPQNIWTFPPMGPIHSITQTKTLVTFEDGKIVTLQTAVKEGQKSTRWESKWNFLECLQWLFHIRSTLELRGANELVYTLSVVGEESFCTQTFTRVQWFLWGVLSQPAFW